MLDFEKVRRSGSNKARKLKTIVDNSRRQKLDQNADENRNPRQPPALTTSKKPPQHSRPPLPVSLKNKLKSPIFNDRVLQPIQNPSLQTLNIFDMGRLEKPISQISHNRNSKPNFSFYQGKAKVLRK